MNIKFSIYDPTLLQSSILDIETNIDTHDYTKNQNIMNGIVKINLKNNASDKFISMVTRYRHSPHVFKEGIRKTANFLSTSGIILDFDNKGEHNDSTIEEFINSDFAKTFAYILYTSKSHNEYQNSYHVYLPLESPISDSKTYRELLMLIGIYIKNQDDLKTDISILKDKGNRFIYPSRQVDLLPEYKNFETIFSIFKAKSNGKLMTKNGKTLTKTLISLGYFLDIPYLATKLEEYHYKAVRALEIGKVDVRPIDSLNNKIDAIVEEGANFVKAYASRFTEPQWWTMGQALYNTYGEHAYDLFMSMINDDKYKAIAKLKWKGYQQSRDEVVERPVSIRSFLYILQENGFVGSYSLEELEEGTRRIDIDLDYFLAEMDIALMTRDKKFYFTRAKSAKTIILNKVVFEALSSVNKKHQMLSNIKDDADGIVLSPAIAELKVSDFLDLVYRTHNLKSSVVTMMHTYDIIDDKGVVKGNHIFKELLHRLTLNSATTESFNVQRIAGIRLHDGTPIKESFVNKVTHIKDVLSIDTSLGKLFYHNPLIEYPADMNRLEGDTYKYEKIKRGQKMARDIYRLLEDDEEAYEFFLDFMAQYTVEYRVNKNRCSIVLTGVRGSGKNTLIENIVGSIFQTKEIVKRDKKIDSSQFSDLFLRKLALFDETEINSWEIEDLLKMTSGGTTIKIRELYKNAYAHMIYAYAVVMSNSRNVLGITDVPEGDHSNQFYVKHLEIPLVNKVANMMDSTYIKANLRCFIETILIPRYFDKVVKYPQKYRYGIPVPVTSALITAKRQKATNAYANIKLQLSGIEDLIMDLVTNDKILAPELNYTQALLVPHLYLFVKKKVLTTQLTKMLVGRQNITGTSLENALLQYNTAKDFALHIGRYTVAGKTYRGYGLTVEIIHNIISKYAIHIVESKLPKNIVKNILQYHSINTIKIGG